MAIIYSQASFKNSRIASRKPTTAADTNEVAVGNGVNTLVAPANPNRTYISLQNLSSTVGDDIRYDYFDNPNMLTEGNLLRACSAIDLESPQTIYAQAVANPVTVGVDEGQG